MSNKKKKKKQKLRLRPEVIRAARRFLAVLIAAVIVLAAGCAIIKKTGKKGRTPETDTPAAGMTSLSESMTEDEPFPMADDVPPAIEGYTAQNRLTWEPLIPYTTANTVDLAADETVKSPYAVLMDAESGEIIAEKFVVPGEETPVGAGLPDVIGTRIYPASLTKLMSILVAYEHCTDLDETTFVMTNDVISPVYLHGLALAGFQSGEEIPVRDLLYGAALPSGAEACVGLAIVTAGDEESFVRLMNIRAQSLGMKNTHFCNCTGLHDDDHYSTLTDIAVLLAYMEQDETLSSILHTYQYTTSPTGQHPEGLELESTVFSRMKGDESEVCEVIGGKTGYTSQARQCLALFALRNADGHRYVSVIAGGETKWNPVFDSIYLYRTYTGASAGVS